MLANENTLFYGNSKRPEIVCLCGSTRFMDEFQWHTQQLTAEGKIVLSIGLITTGREDVAVDPDLKIKLDELHRRKIDLADSVLVLNKYDYIGDSTRSEIAYACENGKVISYAYNTFPEELDRVGQLLNYYESTQQQNGAEITDMIRGVIAKSQLTYANGDKEEKISAYKALEDIED